MKYKKPKLIVTIIAVTLCVAIVAACATNPLGEKQDANNDAPETAATPAADSTPDPTIAPTVEPIPETTPEPELGVEFLRWETDLDGDGTNEYFTIDAVGMILHGYANPCIELADGTKLEFPDEEVISTSHAGLNTYALTELSGKQYLLEYRPQSYGGNVFDQYRLWTIESGELTVAAENSVSYAIASGMDQELVDIDAVLAYYDELSMLWDNGSLLVSSDWYVVIKQLYYAPDRNDMVAPQGVSTSLVIAGNEEAALKYAAGLDYIIVCSDSATVRYDPDLAALLGDDGSADIRTKLEENNRQIARVRAGSALARFIYRTGEYSNMELVNEETNSAGQTVYTFLVHDFSDGSGETRDTRFRITGEDEDSAVEIGA